MQRNLNCDLCGKNDTDSLYPSLSGGPQFGLVQCRNCGLIYLDPRPSIEEIGAYYTSEYYTSLPPQNITKHSLKETTKKFAYQSRCQYQTSQNQRERILKDFAGLTMGWRARRVLPVIGEGKLLDVGCGNGEWIAWIRDNISGWEVEGVEINTNAALQAREYYDLNIHIGRLTDLSLPSSTYDMISFWHSLEHVYDPSATLQEVYRLLRPGGWLGIEVPNIDSWEARMAGDAWYHLAIPVHLYHFSPATISSLLTKCGFQIKKEEHIRGHVGLLDAVNKSRVGTFAPLRLLANGGCKTLGRLSPWGIRIYAVKP